MKREVNEAFSPKFRLNDLNNIKSFSGKLKYCQEHLGPTFGKGSSRVIFDWSDEYVLKLAYNEKGIAQNREECDMSRYSDIVVKCQENADDYSWILQEMALPAKKADFKTCLGITWEMFQRVVVTNYNDYTHAYRHLTYPTPLSNDEYIELYDNGEYGDWFEEFREYMINFNLPVGDLMRISSYGMVDRGYGPEIVVLDSGLTEDVWNNYYKRGRRVNECQHLFMRDPLADTIKIAKNSPLTMGFVAGGNNKLEPGYGFGKFADETATLWNKKIEEDVSIKPFEPKDELHPRFWVNNKLNSKVRMRLLDIADDFVKSLNIRWVKPEDIVFTGSLANYNWTKFSDVDVHVIMDFSKVYKKPDFVKSYFDSKKEEWNSTHENLKIYGFNVEMCVEDLNAPAAATGVYSLEKNEWIKEPKDLSDAKLNKEYVENTATKYIDKIDDIEKKISKEKDSKKVEILSNKMVAIFDKLKGMRKEGLKSKAKEMSSGNIIWKILRAEGYIKKIWGIVNYNYDKQMSIKEWKSIELNEAWSPSFRMSEMDSMKSFEEKLEYCKQHLGPTFGKGSSRVVFDWSDDYVLKLAHNEKGVAQNKVEIDQSKRFPYVVVHCEEYAKDYSWIIEENVVPADFDDFEEVLGMDWDEFTGFILTARAQYGKNTSLWEPMPQDEFDYYVSNYQWFGKFYEYMKKNNLPTGDLMRISSYGIAERDGDARIVVLDSGLTEEILQTYYKKEKKSNLNENEDLIYDAYEEVSPYTVLMNFKESPKGSKQDWTPLIKPSQYSRALHDFMTYGDAMRFPENIVDEWIRIIAHNTAQLQANTVLVGHTSSSPMGEFLEAYGEEFEEWCEKNGKDSTNEFDMWEFMENLGFYDYLQAPDGNDAWSDYGLKPLWKILKEYEPNMSVSEKVILVNRCLDVYHCRGDMSSMFIEGGKNVLSQISNGTYKNPLEEAVTGKDNKNAAALYVYALNKDKKEWCLLCAKRADRPTDEEKGKWNPTMGHLHRGEDMIDGAVRECMEESGVDVSAYKSKIKLMDTHRWGNNYRLVIKDKTTDEIKIGKGDEENDKFQWLPVSKIDDREWAWTCREKAKEYTPKTVVLNEGQIERLQRLMENESDTITLYHGVMADKLEYNIKNGGFTPHVCSEGGPKAIYLSGKQYGYQFIFQFDIPKEELGKRLIQQTTVDYTFDDFISFKDYNCKLVKTNFILHFSGFAVEVNLLDTEMCKRQIEVMPEVFEKLRDEFSKYPLVYDSFIEPFIRDLGKINENKHVVVVLETQLEDGNPGFGNVYLNSYRKRFADKLKMPSLETKALHVAMKKLGLKQVSPGVYRKSDLEYYLERPSKVVAALGINTVPKDVEKGFVYYPFSNDEPPLSNMENASLELLKQDGVFESKKQK